MMVDPASISTTDIGLGVVITIYAFDKLSGVLLKLRNGNSNGNGNGATTVYAATWMREFDRLGNGIDKLAEINERIAMNQQATAANLDRLIALQEQQQHWTGDDRRGHAHGAGKT